MGKQRRDKMVMVSLSDVCRASLVPSEVRRDVISLVIAFSREIEERGLTKEEKEGVVRLLQEFLIDSAS